MKRGKLYLIPTFLAEDSVFDDVLPEKVRQVVEKLEHFVVENEKTARRHIRRMSREKKLDELTLYTLGKHTDTQDIPSFLKPCEQGYDIGLISEAGTPAIADPGADLVALAHANGIEVVPLSGPSSILMALMGSGLSGQCFAFNGYLPIDKSERRVKIKELESISQKKSQAQIFIETPFRNVALLEDLLSSCNSATRLCIACEISSADQYIRTMTVSQWQKTKQKPDIQKHPTVFIIQR